MLGVYVITSVELTLVVSPPLLFGKHSHKFHLPLSGAMLLRQQAWPCLQNPH